MSQHPRTFLLTDLESSTRLWEQSPAEMRAALERHDHLLQEVIAAHRGRVVKSTGDGLHAVFESPADGVAAALAGQQALQAESWPPAIGQLNVRMGLHTGESQERDDDYFGPALNLTARIMAAGHGGQVLLSRITAALTRDALPSGATLRDLGDHRLRSLAEPEQLHQGPPHLTG